MIPATAGLAIQAVTLFIYAQLSLSSGLWLVVAGSVVNGNGHLAAAFASGLHAAFYAPLSFMVIAAVLPAVRAWPAPRR